MKMKLRWTFFFLFHICFFHKCAKESTDDRNKGLGCLAGQTSDVLPRLRPAQLFSASCDTPNFIWRFISPGYFKPAQPGGMTTFASGSLTLELVWTAAHTKYTHPHTPPHPGSPSPFPLSSTPCEATRSCVGSPVRLYLSGASSSGLVLWTLPGAAGPPILSKLPVVMASELLRTLHGPSAVRMKIFNGTGVGTDLPSCQRAVKSGTATGTAACHVGRETGSYILLMWNRATDPRSMLSSDILPPQKNVRYFFTNIQQHVFRLFPAADDFFLQNKHVC